MLLKKCLLDKNLENDILKKINEDYLKSDKIMLILIFLHWVGATFINSITYQTYLLGFIGGGIVFFINLIAYKFYKGEFTFRVVVAISLMIFSAIFIQQHLGRIEMHFHVFVGLAFLTIYKNIIPTLVAGVVITIHHFTFNYLQLNAIEVLNIPIIVFNYGCGYDIVLLHGFFVLIETIILSYFISTKRNQFIEILKTKSILEKLNKSLENRVKDEIKKQREKDRMLTQQSKLASMGEMIGNIAHQWRQPLNALGLIFQKLDIAYSKDKLSKELFNNSSKKAMRLIKEMSSTIDDFRNFFKPNKLKEEFFIKDAIKKSIYFVIDSLNANSIKLEFNDKNEFKFFGYQNELSQVIINLINNSKDALLEKEIEDKKIEIILEKNNLNINIKIRDNANGINSKVIDRIFEPYFTTKDSKGTGIGLYMSKMIIEDNMGGKIFVKNIYKGAEFTIELPLF